MDSPLPFGLLDFAEEGAKHGNRVDGCKPAWKHAPSQFHNVVHFTSSTKLSDPFVFWSVVATNLQAALTPGVSFNLTDPEANPRCRETGKKGFGVCNTRGLHHGSLIVVDA